MINLEKEFVPYQPSLDLKELGFDEKCLAYWFNETPLNPEGQCLVYYQKPYDNVKITNSIIREYAWAPTFSQAFRWFREKYDLRIWIESNYGVAKFEYVIATTNPNFIDKQFNDLSAYKTYEEAELACLIKLIEIVKNKIR